MERTLHAGSLPVRERSSMVDERASPWLWKVLVLAFCHAEAIASTQVLNLLVDPIKGDLHLSDTEYSLLQGLAFAIVAALLGLPAARIADARGRKAVIVVGVVGWSIATIACAFVRSFPQLFAARAVVGLGEVFLFPAAFALIADIVPRRRLSTAMAVFGIGGPIGAGIALIGGGWMLDALPALGKQHPVLAALAPWRLVFVACGLLGGVAVMLLWPLREARASRSRPMPSSEGLMSALVRERSAYAAVVTGMLALSFCVFATTAWAPTFLVRVHGFSPAQAGRFTGLAALVCAVLGVFAIGLIVDRLQRRRSDAVIVVSMALAIGIVAVIGLAACVDDAALSAALLCASYALLGAPTVLSGTALQQMSSERHRAQVGALYVLLVNLASLSLGPTAVALFSDHVFLAPKALGLSLLSANAIACAVALVAFAAARRPFARLRERQLREGATSLEQR